MKLLIEALNSNDNVLKSAAARALAELDTEESPEVAQELIDELASSDPYVIGNVLAALAAQGAEIARNLGPALEDRGMRTHAVRIVFRLGPKAAPAVPALIAALRPEADNPEDVEFQRELRLAIGAVGPAAKAAIPELLKSLDSREFEIRGSSAYALAKIGPDAKEAIPKIREMFRTGDDRLKRLAIWTLLKINPGNPKLEEFAIPLLIKALESDRELARIEASVALGELGAVAQPAIEPLKKLLNDPSPAVRAAAEQALQSLQK
jgi:HEAT repeat protein